MNKQLETLEKTLQNKAVILFLMMFLFMIGIYWIDVGASLLSMQQQGLEITAFNIFITDINPNIMYHAGLLLVLGCFVFLGLLFIDYRGVIENGRKDKRYRRNSKNGV